jgi:hypothetical protein
VGESKTWILTGSLDNFRATREHRFGLIGAKERRRAMAHWQLAFQGQLRTVSDADAELLERRIREAASARTAA